MASKKILIVCSHFWPSLGGLETSMGQLGEELIAAGYAVSVMTIAYSARTSDQRNGVKILSVEQPEFPQAIRKAVGSGKYDACILVQDPLGAIIWSVEHLQPHRRTRLLIQPIINEDGYSRWHENADFRQRLATILTTADAALTMTRKGPDQRYMESARIASTYLPNACSLVPPAGDFRQQFNIPADRFMILHVANLYWVKNHIGLIDALADMPASWQLVMIGMPGQADCVEATRAKLASRPEILYIPGLPPEWVSAAMEAADTVVLASHGEGSPITLLEAMAHRKPWLATPQCGAANDHLGGVICKVDDFPHYLRQLAARPALRQALGEISYRHWQECYNWPVVRQGWVDLIERGALRRSFAPSVELQAEMQALLRTMDAGQPAVDFSVFHVDTYRSGPIRFGWLGNIGALQAQIHEFLIPAMRDDHRVSFLTEENTPQAVAEFLGGIDVLVLTGDQPDLATTVRQAMACGVFPVAIRAGDAARLIEHEKSGLLVDANADALYQALSWCAEHGDEVRRCGYRQAQMLALQS